MTRELQQQRRWHAGRGSLAVWGTAAVVIFIPLVAMPFTDEVAWSLADFVVFGVMLVAACGTYELAVRLTSNGAFRAAVAVAVTTAFLLIWINLAVGIIGNENNAANLVFAGVLAVGIIGAFIARFRSRAMTWVLLATALAQAMTAPVALVNGSINGFVLTLVFVPAWLTSAWLFRKAALKAHAIIN